jgi:predicted nucleic acid-binding protein
LIDTNIIIEILKGNSQIIDQIKLLSNDERCISAITYGELIFGARNKAEQLKLEQKLKELQIVNVDVRISKIFMNLIKNYSLSYKLNIPDALIAASAIVTQSKLLTLNIKDFKYIPDIELYVSSE